MSENETNQTEPCVASFFSSLKSAACSVQNGEGERADRQKGKIHGGLPFVQEVLLRTEVVDSRRILTAQVQVRFQGSLCKV
jgi:hypothetical protein